MNELSREFVPMITYIDGQRFAIDGYGINQYGDIFDYGSNTILSAFDDRLINVHGYLSFNFWHKDKHYYVRVYRLVYYTFVGFISPHYHIHHIDFDKLNNCLDNLQLLSAEEHCKIHRHLQNLLFVK